MFIPDYFQIQDFFAINSENIKDELSKIRVRVKEFPLDVVYWYEHADSEEAEFLKNVLNNRFMGFKAENSISITLAEHLANNEFAERLIDIAFNQSELGEFVFAVPSKMFEFVDLQILYVPDTVKWNLQGRILNIQFDTCVKATSTLPALTDEELEQGISFFKTRKNEEKLRLIFYILHRPNAVELVRKNENSPYALAIKKTKSFAVGLKKFFWQHDIEYEANSLGIFYVIKYFAPDIFKKYKLDSRPFNALLRVSSENYTKWKPLIYVKDSRFAYDNVFQFCENIKLLRNAEVQAIEKGCSVTHETEIGSGVCTLVIKPDVDSDTIEQLRYDIDMLNATVEFLEQELLPVCKADVCYVHCADTHIVERTLSAFDSYCDSFSYCSNTFGKFVLDKIMDTPELYCSSEFGKLGVLADELKTLKSECDKSFRITDFMGINSLDFAEELKNRRVKVNAFPYNLSYWKNNCDSYEARRLDRFLKKQTLHICNNTIAIQLPAQITEDQIIELVNVAFGNNGEYPVAFNVSTRLNSACEIGVQVVPGSVNYTQNGRALNVTFETFVTLQNDVETICRKDTESGHAYGANESEAIKCLGYMVANPDSFVVIDTGILDGDCHMILNKTYDAEFIKKKMGIECKNYFHCRSNALLHVAMQFAPDIAKKYCPDETEASIWRGIGFEKYHSNLRTMCGRNMSASFLEDEIEALKEALYWLNGIEFLSYENDEKKFVVGGVSIFLTLRGSNPQRIVYDLMPKIQKRLDVDYVLLEFIETELKPYVENGEVCEAHLVDYVFDKLSREPEKYTDPQFGGTLCVYAKMLLDCHAPAGARNKLY